MLNLYNNFFVAINGTGKYFYDNFTGGGTELYERHLWVLEVEWASDCKKYKFNNNEYVD